MARIVKIEEHKVKTGESIASLAQKAGITWQDLAIFNWGTDVPEEINNHLRDEVGCTKKTASGKNYMFDDSDTPGIVFVPRVWKMPGLPTEATHVFRVRRVGATKPLRFVLQSETTGHLLPFHPFLVYDNSGQEVARGETNEYAEAVVDVAEEGQYEVVPGDEATFSVSGILYYLDATTPLKNTNLQVYPWQIDAYPTQTGPAGELNLSDIPRGELRLSFGASEYAIFIDGDVSNGVFYMPLHPIDDDPGSPEPDSERMQEDDLPVASHPTPVPDEPALDPNDY